MKPEFKHLKAMLPTENWVIDYLRINEIKAHYCVGKEKPQGLSGNGIKIAIIDNGINENPYFSGSRISKHLLQGQRAKEMWNQVKGHIRPLISEKIKAHPLFPLVEDFPGNDDSDMMHGTNMSSYIVGKKGIAPNAEVILIKAMEGTRRPDFLPFAIHYALAHKVDIINMSLSTQCSPDLHEAVRQAYFQNAIMICAAGNTLLDPEEGDISTALIESIDFPAAYQRTLAIGGYDRNLNHYKAGDRGRLLDFMCPAENVPSLINSDNEIGAGTSIASAICTGIIALFLEKFKDVNQGTSPRYAELKGRLSKASILPKPYDNHNEDWGYGILHPKYLFQEFN